MNKPGKKNSKIYEYAIHRRKQAFIEPNMRKDVPASLMIKEMQIKATMRYNFSDIRLAEMTKIHNTYVGKGLGKQAVSHWGVSVH